MSALTDLTAARYLSLATFRKDGREVATPLWFAESHGKLYVFTLRETGKVKRLKSSSRARVAQCDMRGGVTGPWIDASARLIADSDTTTRAMTALRDKYGLAMRIGNLFSTLTGRVRRRVVIEIEPRPA